MSDAAAIRIPSHTGVFWRALGVVASTTTEGWRDKRPHIVLRSGGCFCWVFWRVPHIATATRNVWNGRKRLFRNGFAHLAEWRHGR